MIPSIEQIVEDLASGAITKAHAVTMLHRHAEDAARTLRDDFAASALAGMNLTEFDRFDKWRIDAYAAASRAYSIAEAMMIHREAGG